MALAEATSFNFQVNAISHYIPERSDKNVPVFFFTYWITIKNKGNIVTAPVRTKKIVVLLSIAKKLLSPNL